MLTADLVSKHTSRGEDGPIAETWSLSLCVESDQEVRLSQVSRMREPAALAQTVDSLNRVTRREVHNPYLGQTARMHLPDITMIRFKASVRHFRIKDIHRSVSEQTGKSTNSYFRVNTWSQFACRGLPLKHTNDKANFTSSGLGVWHQ